MKKNTVWIVMAVFFGLTFAVEANYGPFTRDLTVGSRGDDVALLQGILTTEGYLNLPEGVEFGYFGSMTQAALAVYQSANGIVPASGYFAPVTRAYMAANMNPIPETLPFGQIGIVYALSQVKHFHARVYTQVSGEEEELHELFRPFTSFESTTELAEQIQGIEFDFEVDPRKEVFVQAELIDKDGNVIFDALSSFNMDVVRDDTGKPVGYKMPEDGVRLHFSLRGYFVSVPGVESLSVQYKDQTWNLEVEDGRVWIYGSYALSSDIHTITIGLYGLTFSYDRFGQRVVENTSTVAIGDIQFSRVKRKVVEDGVFEYRTSRILKRGMSPSTSATPTVTTG
jgi:hypothetical protein